MNDLSALIKKTLEAQKKNGLWQAPDMAEEDFSFFCATLHRRVSSVFEQWRAGADPTVVGHLDPSSGAQVSPENEKAIPVGMTITLAEIALEALAAIEHIKGSVKEALEGASKSVAIDMSAMSVSDLFDNELGEELGEDLSDADDVDDADDADNAEEKPEGK